MNNKLWSNMGWNNRGSRNYRNGEYEKLEDFLGEVAGELFEGLKSAGNVLNSMLDSGITRNMGWDLDETEEADRRAENEETIRVGHIGHQELTPAEECGHCDPADPCRTSGKSMQEAVYDQPDLKQAVLWAEILGDPVSVKRRKRRSEKLHGYQGYAGRR